MTLLGGGFWRPSCHDQELTIPILEDTAHDLPSDARQQLTS